MDKKELKRRKSTAEGIIGFGIFLLVLTGSYVYAYQNHMDKKLIECQDNLDARPFRCFIREEVDNRYVINEWAEWTKIDSFRTPIKEVECGDLE